MLEEMVADGMEEMGLSQTHASVNEERIVILGRRIGDRHAGGAGKLIARPHHKILKGIFRIEWRLEGMKRLLDMVFLRRRRGALPLSPAGRGVIFNFEL